MSKPAGEVVWELAFQKSPIILTNGIANLFPGSMFPLIAVTEALNLPLGLLSTAGNASLDNFFADFRPLTGAQLISQDVAHVPFANQSIAANATISQPLRVSMGMIAPARNVFGYFEKLAVMTALQKLFSLHNASGGTYIVATPSYLYTNCLMLNMSSVEMENTGQPQVAWQIDFERPLITLEEAEQAQNGLMGLLTSLIPIAGNPINLAWSGLQTGAAAISSMATQALVPSAVSAVAANTTAPNALAAGLPLPL